MKDKFSVAVGQMNSVDDVDKNFAQIVSLLEQIQNPQNIDLVSFPENALYMRIKEGEAIKGFDLTDEVFTKLSAEAKKRQLNIHLGSVALRQDQKLLNASVFIDKSGEVRHTYTKIHLFDFDLPGHPPVRESDVYNRGQQPAVLTVNEWKLGQSICYDMRFAELYSYYAAKHCEILLMPSSFLVPTGKVHWDILLRARAIESQSYVIAAAQAGEHHSTKSASKRMTYGNSLVVDPWGQIVAQGKPSGPELIQLELDLARIKAVRQQIPMRGHRRLITVE